MNIFIFSSTGRVLYFSTNLGTSLKVFELISRVAFLVENLLMYPENKTLSSFLFVTDVAIKFLQKDLNLYDIYLFYSIFIFEEGGKK